MSHPSPRKVLLAAALFGLSIPVHHAAAVPRSRTRTAAPHESRAATNPWRGLLAFLGLADQTPPPKLPQAGCEIDPDGKCRIHVNPPTP